MRPINANKEIVLNAKGEKFYSAKSGKIIVSDDSYNDFRFFTDNEISPSAPSKEKALLIGKLITVSALVYIVFKITTQ